MKLRSVILGTILFCTGAAAQSHRANYEESKVGTYALPDPLRFNNGKPVRSPRDWNRRRKEILELFATNVYGHSPKPPKGTRFDIFESDEAALRTFMGDPSNTELWRQFDGFVGPHGHLASDRPLVYRAASLSVDGAGGDQHAR